MLVVSNGLSKLLGRTQVCHVLLPLGDTEIAAQTAQG